MTHGGNPWGLLEERPFLKGHPLDFSADLNPLGPPQVLRSFLQEAWDRIGWYPDPTYREFREQAAQLHGVDSSSILPGNGTADLIHLISRWRAKARAAVAVPTFTEYERAVIADGGKVLPLKMREEEGFSPDSLKGSGLPGGTRILFLCNPNNPTGTLWSRAQILPWIESCEKRGILVVVDEAYLDFVEEGIHASVVPWIRRFRRLLVLRSLTKSFAVPGLRIGYLAASPQVIEGLAQIQPPWTMNALAAFVGSRLVQEREFLMSSRENLRRFRQGLWEGLCLLPGLRPFPSVANFFLCRIMNPRWSSGQLTTQLRDLGILIRNCDDFTGLEKGRFIRVAVRLPEENARLIQAMRELFCDAG